MKLSWLLATSLVIVFTPCITYAQNHTQRGSVLGGIAGAVTGAAIGKQNGETTEGALIGGALGLITGAAIGNSMDEHHARSQELQQQHYARLARAVSIQDVVTMSHNGLTEEVIINHIRQNGVPRRLQVAEVIALHQQGVSERVITAMQHAPLATAPRTTTSPYRAPVVVEEHYYVTPRHYHRPYYPYGHYHYHHHHSRPGFHWGVSIGR